MISAENLQNWNLPNRITLQILFELRVTYLSTLWQSRPILVGAEIARRDRITCGVVYQYLETENSSIISAFPRGNVVSFEYALKSELRLISQHFFSSYYIVCWFIFCVRKPSWNCCLTSLYNAQNPPHTFPRNFPVDGEATIAKDLLATRPTSPQQVVVMEFAKQKDTTDFCPRQLVTDLLRGNWCNRFRPLSVFYNFPTDYTGSLDYTTALPTIKYNHYQK